MKANLYNKQSLSGKCVMWKWELEVNLSKTKQKYISKRENLSDQANTACCLLPFCWFQLHSQLQQKIQNVGTLGKHHKNRMYVLPLSIPPIVLPVWLSDLFIIFFLWYTTFTEGSKYVHAFFLGATGVLRPKQHRNGSAAPLAPQDSGGPGHRLDQGGRVHCSLLPHLP